MERELRQKIRGFRVVSPLGKINDAAILPQLLTKDPRIALQALGQFVCNKGGIIPFLGFVAQGVIDDLPGIGLAFPELKLPGIVSEVVEVISLAISLLDGQSKEYARELEYVQSKVRSDGELPPVTQPVGVRV